MANQAQTSFAVPPGAMRLTLVRHGQTQGLPEGGSFDLKHGHGDPLLTDLGHQQAQAVGERLQHEVIDALYVTSLTRTHETAAPLAELTGMQPIEEHELREVFLGDWEGGKFRSMLAALEHPGAIAFRQTYEWGSVPGAETNAELAERTSDAVKRLFAQHTDQHVVAVVHGGVVAALCAYANDCHMRGFAGSDNCAIHRLVVTEDRWFLRAFNDTNHLGGLGSPPAEIVAHA
ncbi:MAG: histidine phosphatase family protein [Actinomycetota bacterium]